MRRRRVLTLSLGLLLLLCLSAMIWVRERRDRKSVADQRLTTGNATTQDGPASVTVEVIGERVVFEGDDGKQVPPRDDMPGMYEVPLVVPDEIARRIPLRFGDVPLPMSATVAYVRAESVKVYAVGWTSMNFGVTPPGGVGAVKRSFSVKAERSLDEATDYGRHFAGTVEFTANGETYYVDFDGQVRFPGANGNAGTGDETDRRPRVTVQWTGPRR